MSKTIYLHSPTYNKIIFLEDFNTKINEQHIKSFCHRYSLKHLIRKPTRFKNFKKPTCIDLILTDMPHSFQSACVIETGLSAFRLMALTVMNFFSKQLSLEL